MMFSTPIFLKIGLGSRLFWRCFHEVFLYRSRLAHYRRGPKSTQVPTQRVTCNLSQRSEERNLAEGLVPRLCGTKSRSLWLGAPARSREQESTEVLALT